MEGGITAGLAAAVANIGKNAFCGDLLAAAGSLVDHDAATLLLFEDVRRPVVLIDRLKPAERGYLYGDYLSGVYRLSPFYLASRKLGGAKVARIKDIAPEGFTKSEYYRRYFALIGVADLIGVLLPAGGGRVLFLSFSRGTSQERFSANDARRLENVLPLLAAAAERHGELSEFSRNSDKPKEEAAPSLPRLGLTARESDVVNLMLQGHSTRSVAATLRISTETVRVHRRHIYEKLGISSQSGLFHWFLSARR